MLVAWLVGCGGGDFVAQLQVVSNSGGSPTSSTNFEGDAAGVIALTPFVRGDDGSRWSNPWELDRCEIPPDHDDDGASSSDQGRFARTGEVTLMVDQQAVAVDEYGIAPLTAWPGGATVGAANRHGGVPDFDLPDAVVVPDLPSGARTPTTDGSYAVTWDPGPGTVMLVALVWEDVTLHCPTADDGDLTVPAEELPEPADDADVSLLRLQLGDTTDDRVHLYTMASASGAVD